MDYYSTCPFCHLQVPFQEIQRHAENHLVDEELSRDLELAHQIAQAPLSPSPSVAYGFVRCETSFQERPESIILGDSGRTGACRGSNLDEKFCSLISLQIKETFNQIEGGLMALLRNCLELDSENSTSILCGYVDHFESRESEDVGWGCGWRNIQMLSSHLLKQRPEAREVLYGGSAFVPDIASLQRWLEIAWGLGFDTQGSTDFDGNIYGKRNWIGTTECAALFRSFGLRAMVVDFFSKEAKLESSTTTSNHMKIATNKNEGKKKVSQVYGPMDRFLSRADSKISDEVTAGRDDHKYSSIPVRNAKSHNVIIDWVWNYFSDNLSTKPCSQPVILSEKAPLYFQHQGHSRTIIGIQAKRQGNGMHQYNLLILDPAHRTEALVKSLKQNIGWQKHIKRGVHTLKKMQYQLCFIAPGIASREELDQLKTIRGIHFGR